MIDDEKIEEAARETADLYEQDLPIMSYNEDTEVDGQHHFCQEFGANLFKDGAKWAINEFLKDLWHPANEEPNKGKFVLMEMLKGVKRMNPEELKIGDLVRVIKDDYLITKGTICKVIGVNAIDFSEFGGHKPVVSLLAIDTENIRSMSCENIKGIPLTKDILLKNGWKEKVMSRGVKNSHMVYTKPDIEEYGYFPIYIEKGIGKEFDVYPFTCNNVCTQIAYIKYVHQLQHLLFGLGLDSSMIV